MNQREISTLIHSFAGGALKGGVSASSDWEYNHYVGPIFDGIRQQFGPLKQRQVDGIDAIIYEWIQYKIHVDENLPDTQLCYILATAWWETGTRMEPVREHFKQSDEEAQKSVESWLMRRGRTGVRNYARRFPNGQAYYGRGFVQLTWRENYLKLGNRLRVDLVANPDLALRLDVAAEILVVGMMEGLFTPNHALPRYVNSNHTDYRNARRGVNGTDKATVIAAIARKFEKALT